MLKSLFALPLLISAAFVPAHAHETPEKQFIETSEARIAYVETGNPEGRAVVFVHGLPFSSYIWRNVTAALPKGDYRLIAPDLAGFGDSTAGEGLYGVDDQARHLKAFLDALKVSDVTLVGHDWGAGIALIYAGENPDNVTGFAQFEGAMPPVYPRPTYDQLPERVGAMFRALREENAEQNVLQDNFWLDTILPTMTAEPLPGAARAEYDRPFGTPEARQPLLEMSRSLPIGGEPEGVQTLYEKGVAWWTSSDVPKLVLYAEPGRLYPETLARWNTENAKNVSVAGVGPGLHALQEEAPEAVAAALAKWLFETTSQ
ncbi:MAG: haloalkane dehalogenase [Pseudomonadota bacterium]